MTKLFVSVTDVTSNSPSKSEADKLLVPGIRETEEMVTKSPSTAPCAVIVHVTLSSPARVVKVLVTAVLVERIGVMSLHAPFW